MSHGKRLHQKLHQAVFPASLPGFIPGNQITIYLETYIYENDTTEWRIADALKRAALRGVNVYMLIDGYGSKDLPQNMLDSLRVGGVKVLIFRPQI
jgi:cardiolipin synthase